MRKLSNNFNSVSELWLVKESKKKIMKIPFERCGELIVICIGYAHYRVNVSHL